MITFKQEGNFHNTMKFLNKALNANYLSMLEQYGREGVDALASATPTDSGETASSWDFKINHGKTSIELCWINTNVVDGVNIAIILQYGHGTGNGGFVQGRDYINPAIAPIFDRIASNAWKVVTS